MPTRPDRTRTIRIAGAGPSGLACAILLRKAGFDVEVHEARETVGTRWKRGLQVIENFSEKEDVLELFRRCGIETGFDKHPVHGVTLWDGKKTRADFNSKIPLGYYVMRGDKPGMLDRSLLDQAQAAGARVVFNSRMSPTDDVQIYSTGPRRIDGLGKEVTFETTLSDRMSVILDPFLAPLGYAYLFVVGGKATLGVAVLREFKNVKMQVAIIGAGLAGLSCGIHLARQGVRVAIYEKNARIGGRANIVDEKGFRIDMGPTLVLMPQVLEGLFETAGRKLSDYLTLQELDPGYRITFGDGRSIGIRRDKRKMLEEARQFAPVSDAAFAAYVKDVQDKFEYSRGTFIERNFESVLDIVSLESLYSFFKIKPFGNAFDHARRHFKNDELALAFSCQNLYLGQSPLKTPSLYNLLAYIEFTYGVWYPKGGMHQIPLALERLFKELGGEIRLNAEVESLIIENKRAKGLKLKGGTIESADAVVSNRDLPASMMNFVQEAARPQTSDARIKNWHYGSSCILFYLGFRKKLKNVLHHNILLAKDTRTALHEIFEAGVLPKEPLLYVCSPTQTDASLAPAGKDILYVLALAPNLNSGIDWDKELPAFRQRVLERIRQNGIDADEHDIELERVFMPKDFESRYGNFYGNAFGLAPDFFQSACFRPMTKSKDVSRFYHVGASTHPGGGIPMVLTCGRLVADQVKGELS